MAIRLASLVAVAVALSVAAAEDRLSAVKMFALQQWWAYRDARYALTQVVGGCACFEVPIPTCPACCHVQTLTDLQLERLAARAAQLPSGDRRGLAGCQSATALQAPIPPMRRCGAPARETSRRPSPRWAPGLRRRLVGKTSLPHYSRIQMFAPMRPDPTPPRVNITGTHERPDFTAYNVLLETRPSFFVAGALYVPKPVPVAAPAVIFTSGHLPTSFRSNSTESDGDDYQIVQLNLVARGYVVLAIDPIGQGERDQYFDRDPDFFLAPTNQHEFLAQQLELNGVAAMSFWLWDEQKSLDYLASLPYVNASKLGVAGCSGGGTQASYLAVMDDRIYAASMACYISTFRIDRLYVAGGGSDGEQTWPHGIGMGLDKPDLLEARAPKPTQVLITTDDGCFPSQGGSDAVAEAQQAFASLGAKDNLVVDRATYQHGYVQPNREALYAFFCNAMPSVPPHPNCSVQAEIDVPRFTHEQLWATTTGQVVTDPAVRSAIVWNFTAAITAQNLQYIQNRRAQGVNFMVPFVRYTSPTLSGYQAPENVTATTLGDQVDFGGQFANVSIGRKWVLNGEGSKCIVPTTLYYPAGASAANPRPAVLIFSRRLGTWMHPQIVALIDELVGAGFVAVVADLCGFGEAGDAFGATSFGDGYGGCEQMATELGRSVAGIHAADVSRVQQFVRGLAEVSGVAGTLAFNHTSTAVMLSAVLGLSKLELGKLALVEPLASWSQMALNMYYNYTSYYSWMFGVLQYYDLCDLAAAVNVDELLVLAPVDPLFSVLPADQAKQAFAWTAEAFAAQGKVFSLDSVAVSAEDQNAALLNWLQSGGGGGGVVGRLQSLD